MNIYIIKRKLSTLFKIYRSIGFLGIIQYTLQRSYQTNRRNFFWQKKNINSYYSFVGLQAADLNVEQKTERQKTINWFIPPFGKGSGGHLNIFRFISNLEKKGYECRIVIAGAPQPVSASQAQREINEWFFPLKANVYLESESLPAAYYSVATEWRTAYWVKNFSATVHRCYFVQDFEPWFFPIGSEYIFAEQTYRFGFVGITAGNWLKDKLALEYGMETYAVGFSYDKNLYNLRKAKKNGSKLERRILFYARPPTPRRAFELGLLVLHEVSKRLSDVQAVFAGWDVSDYEIPFPHRNAGLLDLSSLPALYAECDVALVISLTNLSLLPLELMACGVPVVSNRAPCTEWLLNNQNAHLADPTVDGLAQAICEVLEQSDLAKRLSLGGIKAANQTDWEVEAERFSKILENIDSKQISTNKMLESPTNFSAR